MKNIKNILQKALGLSFIASIIIFPGCKKSFLNVTPAGNTVATQFWQSQADATSAVSAMYANLHEWKNIAFAPIAVESMGSDDVEKGSTPSDAAFMIDFHTFSANSGEGQ